jgi:hypothetical protein
MDYVVRNEGRRPDLDEVHTNRFVVRLHLSEVEFAEAKNGVAEWARYLT